jgi:hypothetical protein
MHKYFFSILIILFFTAANKSPAQTFSKFGIKGGFSVSGLSTFNPNKPFTLLGTNLYVYDKSDNFNFFSFDIGVYTEWFNSEEFCVSAELHYTLKGETDKAIYTVPDPNNISNVNEWESGVLKDKAYYLSFQILPRYRVGISEHGEDNVYLFIGPTFNFEMNNTSSYSHPNHVNTKGPMGDIGTAFGIGFEVDKILSCEIKLDYSLTGSYDFIFGKDEVTRRYNSFSF